MPKCLKKELIRNKYLSEKNNIPKGKHKNKSSIKIKYNIIINNKSIIFNRKLKKNKFLIIINLIIILYISLSKGSIYVRNLNSIEEIILTMNVQGTKSILSSEFNYLPNEVEINGNKISPITSKSFNLEEDVNIIKLYYNSSPTSLKSMFKGIKGITKIDLSNFDISNIIVMSNMFQDCDNVEEIKFSNIKTSSLTKMESLFQNCKNLKSLDLSNFDTSKITNMKNMFNNCEKLEYLDISSFDTTSVQDMSSMFSYCKNLATIDLSNFKTNNANMNEMFHYCIKLKYITFPDNNNMLGSSSMYQMFKDCQAITYLDLSSFDTTSCTTMESLFNN